MVSRATASVLWLLILLSSITLVLSTTTGDPPRVAIVEGNLTIGGLVPMHLPGKDRSCSFVFSALGIEVLEALLFSLDRINANKTFLRGITLGVKAFDTCGIGTASLERAVKDFVLSGARDSGERQRGLSEPGIIGVVGPAYSYEVQHVATFLELFEIPVVSYAASSPELSDKARYKYFFRTVPSDALQTKAIIDLLVYFNWTYVSVVYSDESYGRNGFDYLKQEAHSKGICFANEGRLSQFYEPHVYQDIVHSIISDKRANVVIMFCVESVLVPLMNEFQRQLAKLGTTRVLHFIGSETLVTVAQDLDVFQGIANQALVMHPLTTNVAEFDEYFWNLSPATNTRNPWFKHFFQRIMNCTFEKTTNMSRRFSQKLCNASESIRSAQSTFLGLFSYMPLVIDAVYAFAHALRDLQDRWNGTLGAGWTKELRRELLSSIRSTSFESPSGSEVNFSSTGDVMGGYDIYILGEVAKNHYADVRIGEWKDGRLNLVPAKWKDKFVPQASRCSDPCSPYEVRRRIADKPHCCWECEPCSAVAFAVNLTHCVSCPKGHLPHRTLRLCVKIQAKYFSFDGSVSLFLVALPVLLSAMGIIGVGFVAFVFCKFNDTPLVKASGRELSYLLLGGLFGSFLFAFVAISKPSPFKCFWQFTLDSLPFTVSYVAIAVKNNRVFRIFNPERLLTAKPALLKPKSQIIVSLGLISFQVLFLLALMLLDFPRDQLVYPTPTEVHHICVIADKHVFSSHLYNIILLVVCTYYAYKTRSMPRNFNEAKHIAFAMYGSCIMAVTFLVVYAVVARKMHKLAVHCFRVVFMSLVLLLCFFARKVYVILFKPEQNIHRSTNAGKGTDVEGSQNDRDQLRSVDNRLKVIAPKNVGKVGKTSETSTQTSEAIFGIQRFAKF